MYTWLVQNLTSFGYHYVFYIRQQLENFSISEMGTERLTSAKVSSSLQNKGEDKATMLFNQLFQRYQQLLLKWR